MDDRELLEMAAKAAGISGGWGDKIEYHNGAVDLRDLWILEGNDFVPWNPLTDDGDALRLACQLQFDLALGHRGAMVTLPGKKLIEELCHQDSDENLACTRRAIVRAAAEIGRAM